MDLVDIHMLIYPFLRLVMGSEFAGLRSGRNYWTTQLGAAFTRLVGTRDFCNQSV